MKVVFAFVVTLALTACSTVAGVGKDLTSSAEWTKEKIGGK
jgi:predicted small secreted protein